jgi:hypothetical protein
MQWLRTVLREIYGLFVDDGSFALAILLWIGLCSLMLHRVPSISSRAILLFAGLALILLWSVLRFRGRSRP